MNTRKIIFLPVNVLYMYIIVYVCWIPQVLTVMAAGGNASSPDQFIRVFRQLFCVKAYPHLNLVRLNDFSDLAAYFIQQVGCDIM